GNGGFASSYGNRPEILDPCIGLGYPMRHFHLRRWNLCDASEHVKHIFKRQVWSAQNVAFAWPALFGGKQVTAGAVAHVDQIHSGVYVTEHFALQVVDHDFSSRRRLDIHFADRGARVHDHYRQVLTHPLADLFFGLKLTSLVIPDHVVDLHRRGLGGRRSVRIEAETSDGAGINNAFNSLVECSSHHVGSPADVG